MSIKDQIRAEIERRMEKHWGLLPNADSPEDDWTHNELCELGAFKELEYLETFLDSLQQEKPEINIPSAGSGAMGTTPPKFKLEVKKQPERLEEAAKEYAEKHGFRVPYDGSNNFYDDVDVKASKEGFIAGAEWQKAKMMEEAVERVVKADAGGYPYIDAMELYDYENDKPLAKAGDKVRVIVIKEDEK